MTQLQERIIKAWQRDRSREYGEIAAIAGASESHVQRTVAKYGGDPSRKLTPAWAKREPKKLVRVRCLGPISKEHFIMVEDPRRQRLCPACKGINAERAGYCESHSLYFGRG